MAVPTRRDIETALLAPGSYFELVEESVGGQLMPVFKNRARSLRQHVEASVGFGEREYVVFGERRLTFEQHAREVAALAKALRVEYGVGPGDRVGILAANCAEWVLTFWATVSLGAIAVGLNGWWVGDEIRFGVADAEPKVVMGDRKRLDRVDHRLDVPIIVAEDDVAALIAAHGDAALPDQPIDEDDPAVILYTSGTTGRPKGAINTHRNINALLGLSFFHGLRRLQLSPPPPDAAPTCQYMTSPLFHVSGLHNGAVAFLAGGVKSVWHMGRFDPGVAMATMEAEKVTGWSITSAVAWRLVRHPDAGKYDLSSVTQVGGGGSPIPGDLQARLRDVFPNAADSIGVGYGMTECSALATLAFGDELIAHPDTVGSPLPTVQLEIRDQHGKVLGENAEGEVFVRGPMVMPGYWRRPEETAAVLSADGWLRTGDLGAMVDGRLYLSARRSDLILRGGENVYPAEIERRLDEHPDVVESVVYGVEHPELGHDVAAVVVLRDSAETDEAALARGVGEALAYFKVPAQWRVQREPLPRTATGKVQRHVAASGERNTFQED